MLTGLAGAVSAGGGARGPLELLPPDPPVPGDPRLGVAAAGLPPHLQVLLAAPLPVRGRHHGEQPPLQRPQHALLPLQIIGDRGSTEQVLTLVVGYLYFILGGRIPIII